MAKTRQLRRIRGHCPLCGPQRFAEVVGEYIDREEIDDEEGVWAETTCRILQCGGCESVYFQEIYVSSEAFKIVNDPDGPVTRYEEHVKYYPAPGTRKRPDWVSYLYLEDGLLNLLTETYNALDVDAKVLAAAGARTLFDRASELLEIDPAVTFKEKLDALHTRGQIGSSERNHLDLLVDAGSAAAHRGWMPSAKQLDTVMSIVEAFIYRTFVLDAEVRKLKQQIPRRQKRRKLPSNTKLSLSASGKQPVTPVDIPGVMWTQESNLYRATWLAPPTIVQRGYPIASYKLWEGALEHLTEKDKSHIRKTAHALTQEMSVWDRGGIKRQ